MKVRMIGYGIKIEEIEVPVSEIPFDWEAADKETRDDFLLELHARWMDANFCDGHVEVTD